MTHRHSIPRKGLPGLRQGEGRKEVMGFMLRQEAAEHRWLLLEQCSPGPTMEPGGRRSPGGQDLGITTPGSKTLLHQAGRSQKLGVTPGNKAGGQQQLPRARTGAGQQPRRGSESPFTQVTLQEPPNNLQGCVGGTSTFWRLSGDF